MNGEKLQLVDAALGLGKLDRGNVAKENIMPLSCAGGARCMTKNFHDAIAVSRIHASPDIFATFTCNPKWPQITESLEAGQKPVDRTDMTVRVYHMKLLRYLQKIMTGKMFGPVVAVLNTVEFQRRSLPHVRILVWQKKDHNRVATPTFINSFGSTSEFELIDVDADAAATAPDNTMQTTLSQPPVFKRLFYI